MARSHGADERPACPKCGKPTHVTRRSPSVITEGNEDQIFTCGHCGHTRWREANSWGDVKEGENKKQIHALPQLQQQ